MGLAYAEIKMQIGGSSISFVEESARRLTISKNCLHQKKFSCQAFTAFKKSKKSKAPPNDLPPQAAMAICKKQNGQVITGLTESKNEITFCYFKKDLSYVDLGSLYASLMGWAD